MRRAGRAVALYEDRQVHAVDKAESQISVRVRILRLKVDSSLLDEPLPGAVEQAQEAVSEQQAEIAADVGDEAIGVVEHVLPAHEVPAGWEPGAQAERVRRGVHRAAGALLDRC